VKRIFILPVIQIFQLFIQYIKVVRRAVVFQPALHKMRHITVAELFVQLLKIA
jgi:hypothetical protein